MAIKNWTIRFITPAIAQVAFFQMVEAHFHIGEQEIISAIAPGMSRALERMNQVESRSLGVINP